VSSLQSILPLPIKQLVLTTQKPANAEKREIKRNDQKETKSRARLVGSDKLLFTGDTRLLRIGQNEIL